MSEEAYLLNVDKNKNVECLSVTYKLVVLCLVTISAFFTTFTYYSLENDSSDIKNLLTDISSKLMLNNSY